MRTRSTIFTCLVYPDSSPDFLDKVKDLHIQGAISPLHEFDVDGDGVYKKPHYHVILKYSSLKSIQQAKEDFSSFGGIYPDDEKLFQNTCIVRSLPTALRYLCHLDNPEKHQYNTCDVIELGGLSYSDEIMQDVSFSKACSDIMAFVHKEHISSFFDLCMVAQSSQKDWLPYIIRYAYFFKSFIGSFNVGGVYKSCIPVDELDEI